MRVFWGITFIVWLTVLGNQPAFADRRVALVIGNSGYQNVARLGNPSNDAAAITTTLKDAGFDLVETKRDLKISEMRRVLRDFANSSRDADVSVVYYAGHGIEVDGANYLIAVDATLEQDIDVYDEAFSLDRILAVVEPAKKLRLVILDACRDNPFAKTMKRTVGSRAIGRGLAKVEPNSPNTLIAFASKAGSTASDGDSKNSPFTAALVKHITKPGLDLRKAFGFVRDEVLKDTGNRQEPYVYGSLGGDDVPLVPAKPVLLSPASTNAEVRGDYELALQVGTKDVWNAFLKQYPDGLYASLAAEHLRKISSEGARFAVTEGSRLTEEEKARFSAASDGNKSTTDKQPRDGLKIALPNTIGVDLSPTELITSMQFELRRVGCLTALANGEWDIMSQHSLILFNRYSGTKLDANLASIDALEAVKAKPGRVCPLVCEHGYEADGDSCTKIVCTIGFEVGDKNTCARTELKKPKTPFVKLAPLTKSKSDAPRNDVSARDNPSSSKSSGTKSEKTTSDKCSSVQARCAIEIGGRCANGHWEYGRNGAGGNTLAFNTCIGNKLLAGKK